MLTFLKTKNTKCFAEKKTFCCIAFALHCIVLSCDHHDEDPPPLNDPCTPMEKRLLPADKTSVRLLLPVAIERCSQRNMTECYDIQGCKDRLRSSYPLSNLYDQG